MIEAYQTLAIIINYPSFFFVVRVDPNPPYFPPPAPRVTHGALRALRGAQRGLARAAAAGPQELPGADGGGSEGPGV